MAHEEIWDTQERLATRIRRLEADIRELETFRNAQLYYVKTNEADKHAMQGRIARLESRTLYMPDDPDDIMAVFRTEAAAEGEGADPFDTGLIERPL